MVSEVRVVEVRGEDTVCCRLETGWNNHNRGMAIYVDAADAFTRPGDSETTGGVRLRPLVELVAPKVPAAGDDLLKPGPWAPESVPSSAPGKITQAEGNLLNPNGDASGCHSCGATTPGTKSGNWIGDHQPVSRTVEPGTPHVLYPHCQKCSNAQGLWIINLMRQGKL